MSSVKKLILILIIAAVVIAAGFITAGQVEKHLQTAPEGAGTSPSAGTSPLNDESDITYSIVYNGQEYTYNNDLKNILLIGVDNTGTIAEMTEESEDLCDFILLVSMDETTGDCRMIQLNRDSMVDVTKIYSDGSSAVYYESLAFAHSGTGSEEDKCASTVQTVSSLLYDIPIDNYVAINMGGIPPLVDLVGGVTLTIQYDFSQSETALSQYAVGDVVTFDGDGALEYVRTRYYVGDNTNADRMVRQQDFMIALSDVLRSRYNANPAFALEAYAAVTDYLVSDMSADELMDFADQLAQADTSDITIPDGEVTAGSQFTEFYIDEDALQQLVVEDFFLPAE